MSELGSMALVAMLLVVVDRRICVCALLVATLEGLDCTLGVLAIAATDWKLVLTLVELQQGAY
jgi:hypothetical protein